MSLREEWLCDVPTCRLATEHLFPIVTSTGKTYHICMQCYKHVNEAVDSLEGRTDEPIPDGCEMRFLWALWYWNRDGKLANRMIPASEGLLVGR
jgi:hypothetical protein